MLLRRLDRRPDHGAGAWPVIGAGGWTDHGAGDWPADGAGAPIIGMWGSVDGCGGFASMSSRTVPARRRNFTAFLYSYLEEDGATLLSGQKAHLRNALCNYNNAELLMCVGWPLRAKTRQSGYDPTFQQFI